jgi:hypothetical protein
MQSLIDPGERENCERFPESGTGSGLVIDMIIWFE